MRKISYLTLCLSLVTLSAAQAGFEWVPPSKDPKPSAVPNVIDLDDMPEQMIVKGEERILPTYRPLAPSLSTLPGQDKDYMATGKLSIDPYPLGRNRINNSAMELSEDSVEQAMIEKTGRVTPMMLGDVPDQAMQTGAQISRAPEPTVQFPKDNPASFMMEDMTPVGQMGAITTKPQSATPIVQYASAEGFGKDLPLALAVTQIVPADFTHSFGIGVDPGLTVSWEGGKPWNIVLEDMLKPQGLTATIQGDRVLIQPVMAL